MKRLLIIAVLACAPAALAQSPATDAPAAKPAPAPHALDRLKALAGDWSAEGLDGNSAPGARMRYEVTAGGSAVLETLFPGASPRLRVLTVHNPNPFVVVGSIDGTPLRLAPREVRELGLLPQGELQAQPDADFLRTLPPVQCSAIFSSGSYPSAPLELTLGCTPP